MCSPGHAATPETPQFPSLGIPKGWGQPQVTPTVSCHSPGLWGWASPMDRGRPQWELCPTDPVWGSATCALPSGPYLSAWCGSGGYGRSRGCATRLGHFMGQQGPVGRRARGSGHPTGHLPALGTHGCVTRRGSTLGHCISPPSHAATSPHLVYLGYFLLAPGSQQASG